MMAKHMKVAIKVLQPHRPPKRTVAKTLDVNKKKKPPPNRPKEQTPRMPSRNKLPNRIVARFSKDRDRLKIIVKKRARVTKTCPVMAPCQPKSKALHKLARSAGEDTVRNTIRQRSNTLMRTFWMLCSIFDIGNS